MRQTLAPFVVSAVLGGLSLSACGDQPEKARPAAPAAVAGAVTVESRLIPDMKPVAGEITTRDMGQAVARTGGVLIRLNVREGDAVRAGQVLGVVRDARIGLETASYTAMARAAEAEAARAEADLARTRGLFEKGVYAQARLDQVEAAARAARGNLDAVRAQRAASAEMGAQGAILAPGAGRVLKADVPVGAVVMPGQSIAVVTSGPVVVRVAEKFDPNWKATVDGQPRPVERVDYMFQGVAIEEAGAHRVALVYRPSSVPVLLQWMGILAGLAAAGWLAATGRRNEVAA